VLALWGIDTGSVGRNDADAERTSKGFGRPRARTKAYRFSDPAPHCLTVGCGLYRVGGICDVAGTLWLMDQLQHISGVALQHDVTPCNLRCGRQHVAADHRGVARGMPGPMKRPVVSAVKLTVLTNRLGWSRS